jgi:hypothetical protein
LRDARFPATPPASSVSSPGGPTGCGASTSRGERLPYGLCPPDSPPGSLTHQQARHLRALLLQALATPPSRAGPHVGVTRAELIDDVPPPPMEMQQVTVQLEAARWPRAASGARNLMAQPTQASAGSPGPNGTPLAPPRGGGGHDPIRVFAEVDVDGSGTLTRAELVAALTAGAGMSEGAVERLFSACGADRTHGRSVLSPGRFWSPPLPPPPPQHTLISGSRARQMWTATASSR